MAKVKQSRRRGFTRVSAKHQITLPVEALGRAGVKPGDSLAVRAEGPGRIVLTRERDALEEHAGSLTGVYQRDELNALRDEWR